MKQSIIGFDLTSDVSSHIHGMSNLLMDIILAAKYDPNEDFKINLYCTEASHVLYRSLECEKIRTIKVKKGSLNSLALSERPNLLVHFYNSIFDTIPFTPNVVVLHDLTPLRLFQHYKVDPQKIAHIISPKPAHIITDSMNSRLQLLNSIPIAEDLVSVVAFPINTARTKPVNLDNLSLPEKYIFYPSAFRLHKNHYRLFLALTLRSDINLVLSTGEIHDSAKADRLDELTSDFKLSSQVRNLRHMDRDTYLEVMQNSCGVICPSLAEGFGIPALEGLSCGKKVAVSNTNALAEHAKYGAFLFNPYSVTSIEGALSYLYSLNSPVPTKSQIASLNIKHSSCGSWKEFKTIMLSIDKQRKRYISPKLRNVNTLLTVSSNTIMAGRILQDNRQTGATSALKFLLGIKSGRLGELMQSESANISAFLTKPCTKKITQNILIFCDLSRLLVGSPFSGINKYIEHLYDALSQINNLILVPFFEKKSIGLGHLNLSDSPLPIKLSSTNKTVWALSSVEIPAISVAFEAEKIYLSFFHPLPPNRLSDILYSIIIYDVIHLTHKNFYPDGKTQKYSTNEIVRSVRSDDLVLTISDYSKNSIMSVLDFVPLIQTIYASVGNKSNQDIAQPCVQRDIDILIPFQKDPRKCYDLMVDSALAIDFDMLAQDKLTIGVFGKNIPPLQQEILGRSNIIFFESPSDSELLAIYRRSKLLLYLSAVEGFGIPPLEAMSSGCFPVMRANSSLKEIFRGWEFLIPDHYDCHNISLFVTDALKAFHFDSKKKSLSQAARVFVDTYTWELVANLVLASFYIKNKVGRVGP